MKTVRKLVQPTTNEWKHHKGKGDKYGRDENLTSTSYFRKEFSIFSTEGVPQGSVLGPARTFNHLNPPLGLSNVNTFPLLPFWNYGESLGLKIMCLLTAERSTILITFILHIQ